MTFYALRRAISNYFHECVSKVMVVGKKANFCNVAGPSCHFIITSFPLEQTEGIMSYYVDFEGVFGVFHLR